MKIINNNIGVYIHVPFCSSICSYCNFYSGIYNEQQKDDYVEATLRMISAQPYGQRDVDTVYFGGGTPTVLGSERITEIIKTVRNNFNVLPTAQITVEANPESTSYNTLLKLKKAGVNRVSFGVQSALAKELKALNRKHTILQSKEAILNAKKAGIEHISADLMLGIPYQTQSTLKQSLDFITSLPVDHISAYMLSVEPETAIAKLSLDQITMPEDNLIESYLEVISALDRQGFKQYEISNFAKDGGVSRHNIKYWLLEECLGIGPSAHSFVEGKRFEFKPDIDDFKTGDWGSVANITVGGDASEYAMLRLRLTQGMDLLEYKKNYPAVDLIEIIKKAETFKNQGYLNIENNQISFTSKGFLLSNYIIAELII